MRKMGALFVGLSVAACGVSGLVGATAATAEPLFKDISKRHWARSQIERAISQGYVEGYPDGTFNAKAPVTRAEFTKMLVDALRLPHSQGGLPWYQGYISAALEFGLLDETDSTDYGKPIKRIEMIRMLSRALALEAPYREYLESFGSFKKDDMPFADRLQFQNRDVPGIALAYGSGVVNGYPDQTMQIHRTATRSETVVMIESFLEVRTLDPLTRGRLLTFSSTGKTFAATKIEALEEEQE